jgi:EAL domain-containing protein (putative c-di-GMP-specific phosphodiesterase class I)
VRRGACLGYEALVRATDGDGEPLGPERLFARCADASRVVLDWACRALHLRNYAIVDPGNRTLFLNVHPEAAVSDAGWGRELGELIRYYGLVPRRVCVEILESECSDEGLLREAVSIYRALGATVAMDDFGVGRSNFDRVVALRPDVVKIDRSLLGDAMPGEEPARRMLARMVELLHEAGARVAMEGIETEAEARFALDVKADYLQGHYLAAPDAGLADEAPATARLRRLLGATSARSSAAA